ncbi:protein of unknown function DUF427 [Planoprotostelium fungivorum]|uniref:DUF427 domain-containing protein n=1 Tax=Planoprotostelium fungivorum TaxID=1890364 RepID=A0A2P6NGR5_9EUKA|nr:protein of unknown function DUF427 [Planoprotostelium fungivorum]
MATFDAVSEDGTSIQVVEFHLKDFSLVDKMITGRTFAPNRMTIVEDITEAVHKQVQHSAAVKLCCHHASTHTQRHNRQFATKMSNHPVESVWDYPRPPACLPVKHNVKVVYNGQTIADSNDAHRVLETSHPPTYYIPLKDIRREYLQLSSGPSTFCEWKGRAGYYNVKVGDKETKNAAWFYSDPTPGFAAIKDAVCFYPSKMEACYVDGEKVASQQSDFYGGWITSWIDGGQKGFKGPRGTEWW